MVKRSFAGRPECCGSSFLILLVMIAAGISGCGGSGSGVPARAGEVWEIDAGANGSAMPGAVLAYINGLHVIVLDGESAYAGMTPLKTEPGSNGGRVIKLANGLEAQLVPVSAGALELRFSSGESIGMRKRAGGEA